MQEFFERKKELIKRDPIYNELLCTFEKVCDYEQKQAYFKDIESFEEKKYELIETARLNNLGFNYSLNKFKKSHGVDRLEFSKIENYYATLPFISEFTEIKLLGDEERKYIERTTEIRKEHEQKYPDHWKLFRLSGEVGYKWGIELNFYYSKKQITMTPYICYEPILEGTPPFTEYTTFNASFHYPNLLWYPRPNPFGREPSLADINEFVTPGYKCPGKWIPILIDVSRFNKSDAKKVKKLLWKIVEANLEKGGCKKPPLEHTELDFLYRIKEKKFQLYLKWYDFHIEGLPFRTIATYEIIEKESPDRLEEGKKKIEERTKIVNTKKGRKVLKGVIGIPVKGEDAVEKAVKTIYFAIHRKPYLSKRKRQSLYNCPKHKQDCQHDCTYLLIWMKDFNKRKQIFSKTTVAKPELDIENIDENRKYYKTYRKTKKKHEVDAD